MSIDDRATHAAARQLAREHQSGRSGAYDQYVRDQDLLLRSGGRQRVRGDFRETQEAPLPEECVVTSTETSVLISRAAPTSELLWRSEEGCGFRLRDKNHQDRSYNRSAH